MATKDLGVSGVLFTDRRKFYLNENKVSELWPSATPFTSFTKKLRKVKTIDPDFKMFEHRSKWYDQKFSAGTGVGMHDGAGQGLPTAGSSFTIVANSTAMVASTQLGRFGTEPHVGLLLDIYSDLAPPNTDANLRGQAVVTAVSGSVLTLKTVFDNGMNAANAQAAADSMYCHVVGHSAEEGSGSPEAWNDELELRYNSCGIFKTPVEVTGTLLAASMRGYSNELARLRSEKMKEHAIKLEKAFFESRRVGNTTAAPAATVTGASGLQMRTMHGIIPIIQDQSNEISVNIANYSWAQWVDDMQTVFQYSNDAAVKYGFCGDGFLGWISKLDSDNSIVSGIGGLSMNAEEKTGFGFNIRKLYTPFGILNLVRSPLLTKSQNGLRSNTCVVVDPENISYVTYRSSKYETAIQANDIDGIKDQYFSDCGVSITLPESHFLLKLVS